MNNCWFRSNFITLFTLKLFLLFFNYCHYYYYHLLFENLTCFMPPTKKICLWRTGERFALMENWKCSNAGNVPKCLHDRCYLPFFSKESNIFHFSVHFCYIVHIRSYFKKKKKYRLTSSLWQINEMIVSIISTCFVI